LEEYRLQVDPEAACAPFVLRDIVHAVEHLILTLRKNIEEEESLKQVGFLLFVEGTNFQQANKRLDTQ